MDSLPKIRNNALALTIACDELISNPPAADDLGDRLAAVAKLAAEVCADARLARAEHRAADLQPV